MQLITQITSFWHNHRWTTCLVVALVVILIVSVATCSGNGNGREMDITDAPSALKAHQSFLKKVSGCGKTSPKELVALTKEWFVLSDTLFNHIQPDSAAHKVYDLKAYSSLQDSVADVLERIVDSEIRTLEDVLTVRDALAESPTDTLFINARADAEKFFASLDDLAVPELSRDEAIDSYALLLKNHLKKGIKSKADMQRFIRAEDLAFRAFLLHLHELGNISLKNITSKTESVCELIFKSAHDGQIPSEVSLVYMMMRTNRRIIQNSMTCLTDVKDGRVTGKDEQAVVYLWMMMKPFFPSDDWSLALLTDRQREDMHTLAQELPTMAAKLNDRMGFAPLPIEEMPNEIIKEYIGRR